MERRHLGYFLAVGALSAAALALVGALLEFPVLSALLGAAVGLGLGYLAWMDASPDTRRSEEAIERVAAGDLTEDPGPGAAGRLVLSLRSGLGRMRTASDSLGRAREELSERTGRLLTAARRQADAAGRSLAEVDRIGNALERSDETVQQLVSLSGEAIGALDETAHSVESVGGNLETLHGFVAETRSSVDEMVASLREFAEAGEHLRHFADEADAFVRAVASGIDRTRTRAEETGRQAREVTDRAERGFEMVGDAVQGLVTLQDTVQRAAGIVDALGDRSVAIGRIVDVISDITDQTNLLALNAAILAAQAGEHGKSFAVVADEIRELAERTGRSTREISALVTDVTGQVDEAVRVMGEGREQAASGLELAERASSALEDIRTTVGDTFGLVDETVRETAALDAEGRKVAQASKAVTLQVEAISRAATEQAREGGTLSERTQQVLELAEQAHTASTAQVASSRALQGAMRRVQEGVGAVRESHESLRSASQRVRSAVTDVQHDADGLIGLADHLSRTVQQIGRGLGAMTGEIGRFRLPTARRGGRLRLAIREPDLLQASRWLDPRFSTGFRQANLVSMLDAGLVRAGEQGDMLPDLAESWTVSESGRQYTFSLRDGATFDDGSPLDAAAVKAAFESHLTPGAESPWAWLFAEIEGADAYRRGDAPTVSGLQAEGRTLRIRLARPRAFFLAVLSSAGARIARVRGERHVTTGPFRLEDAVPGHRLVLTRRDTWRPVHLDGIDIDITKQDDEALIRALVEGRLDMTLEVPARYRRDPASLPAELVLHRQETLSTQMVLFNCARPPLNDPEVRRALRGALDVEALLAGEPNVSRATSLIPGVLPGHVELPRPPLDPAGARRVLAAKGIEGLTLTLPYRDGAGAAWLEATRALFRPLEQLGVRLEWVAESGAEYFRRLAAGEFDLTRVGWVADYPDADGFVYPLFHSAAQTTFKIGYRNGELDDLLDQARRTIDPDVRADLYRRAERVLHEDAALVPLFHGVEYLVTRRNVGGVRQHPTEAFVVEDAWINDGDGRATSEAA